MNSLGVRFWCLMTLITALGCRSGLPGRITDQQLQTHGVVVGSLAHPSRGTDYTAVSFVLTDTASGKKRWVRTERALTGFREDFQNEHVGAGVFAVAIPPGRYELQKPGVAYHDGQSTRSIQSQMRHPIDVRAGEIVYLGEIFISPEYEQREQHGLFAALSPPAWEGVDVSISDKLPRDLSELRKRYPNVPWNHAENAVNRWPMALRTRRGPYSESENRLVNHERYSDR